LLADYFRAPDVAAAQEHLTDHDGASPLDTFDGADLKNLDPTMHLSRLLALMTGRPYSLDLAVSNLVWEHPSSEGPWVVVFDDEVRDTLAGIPAGRLPDLAAQWAAALEAHDLLGPAQQLTGLATRARDAGEPLFCWMAL
jgi:hypothetical protein